MARISKEQKRINDFISVTCQNALYGYQINIMDMSKLSKAGEMAVESGGTNADIEAAIHAARDTYAKAA
jgi:hypothetical protein